MQNRSVSLVTLFAFVVIHAVIVSADDNWPQFRGRGASGLGSGNPPVSWDVESGENILWKVETEGLGHSSPVVWGDRIFTTTAVNSETDEPTLQTGWLGGTGKAAEDAGEWSWQVLCHDLNNGDLLWKKTVASGKPIIKRHLKASHANCSPATNGEYVIAFFGSEGLYCFDMDGELKWKKDFGRLHSGPYNAEKLEWGFASSPIIFDDNVIVQCDCLNTGFVSILDIATGDEFRRIERADVATWATPAIVNTENRLQVVCNGYKEMAGYDLETGEKLWWLAGGGDVPVPTPLFADGLILLTNGHGRSPSFCISPSATGDLTPSKLKADNAKRKNRQQGKRKKGDDKENNDKKNEDKRNEDKRNNDDNNGKAEAGTEEVLPDGLVWWQPRDGSYMPTPIIVGELLYTCNDNGRLAVRELATGEEVYRRRVSESTGTYSASAVATPSQIYFSNEAGKITVVKPGREYELIAENDMGETVMATPAISGDKLLIRTVKHLVCIGDD